MLKWFFSHIAALVGDLAGFLVPLSPVGFLPLPSPLLSSPPLSSLPLLVRVMGAWTPGVGAHGWVAGIASHGSATRSRGGLAGFQLLIFIYLFSYLSSSSSSSSSSLTNNYSRLDQKLLVRIPQTNSNIFPNVMLMTEILYQEQLVLGHFKFLC